MTRNTLRLEADTPLQARTVIAACLILAVGEDEARRLMRLADMSPEVAK